MIIFLVVIDGIRSRTGCFDFGYVSDRRRGPPVRAFGNGPMHESMIMLFGIMGTSSGEVEEKTGVTGVTGVSA